MDLPSDPVTTGELSAFYGLAGLAVQQALQIADPLVDLLLSKLTGNTPGPPAIGDWKRSLMGLLAFGLGCLLVAATGLHLLKVVAPGDVSKWIDLPVSAFVLASGGEVANTVQKSLSYLKQAASRAAAAPAG